MAKQLEIKSGHPFLQVDDLWNMKSKYQTFLKIINKRKAKNIKLQRLHTDPVIHAMNSQAPTQFKKRR